MALICPDCGQRTALVKVSLFVDPYNTSIESMTPQVAQLLGMQPDDFPDEAEVECTVCGAEVPYRLALVATHRADAHNEAKKEVEALKGTLNGLREAWKSIHMDVPNRIDNGMVNFIDTLLLEEESSELSDEIDAHWSDLPEHVQGALMRADEADASEESSEED